MFRRDTLRLTGLASGATLVSAPLAAIFVSPARAAFVDAPDVVVFCDPELRQPMRALGGIFRSGTGVPVRLLCAPAGIMAAQLVRHERCDILVSLVGPATEQLAGSGLLHSQDAVGRWRNRLVVARNGPGTGAAPAKPEALPELLGGGTLGAPDPSVNAIIDTPALIRGLGLEEALAGRITGEIDTGGVAWLLARDRVALGLMLATDARSGGFSPAVAIPDDAYPALRYRAGFTRHVLSRNADAFMRFLATGAARASLAGSGLEIET